MYWNNWVANSDWTSRGWRESRISKGASGTTWEIDANGKKADTGAMVVIECRRCKDKLKQKEMVALAYTIGDVGASGRIIMTPIGVQKGGQKIAEYEGIEQVRLAASSTTTDYMVKFLDKVTSHTKMLKPQGCELR
jgi:hypothetical protein